ncbi:DUF1707 and DUF4870 domain-containing protein [Marinactinospora thermotolerans]|uniref:Uncharacterized conserved protein, Tic20 family n=1 Tax=Marinactinospora thermotolerans DSM 45154 TaxID=1122192 RepID=A0A1T4T2X7_9ACTN|nr:DUF1707 and DUF4870 domain-containing protein [Marinactinospora thermotolerans]SKA34870.1 Uncharacterized conserved protein, Tic20 family [Marinactinospora thermotolerans DSM 45154]
MAVYNPNTPHPSSNGPWHPDRSRSTPVPADQLRVTHADRDAVADRLKDAFADGQLDETEFDQRLDLAMNAKVRADLVPLLQDLTPAQHGPAAAPAPPWQATEDEASREDRVWALGAHVSGYFTLCLGPLLVLLIKNDASPFLRRQVLEALNYQLNFFIASLLMSVLWILILPVFVYLFMVLGWVFLPLLAGVAAALGYNWRYPFVWRIVKNGSRGKNS